MLDSLRATFRLMHQDLEQLVRGVMIQSALTDPLQGSQIKNQSV
jgi:hypothetical protein